MKSNGKQYAAIPNNISPEPHITPPNPKDNDASVLSSTDILDKISNAGSNEIHVTPDKRKNIQMK